MCWRSCKSWQEKILKSDHPTACGKTSKKEKKRTNQILQSNNENKTNWKRSMISGVFLEASFIVITFKIDENFMCHKKAHFLNHSSNFDAVRRTNTKLDILQECEIDDHWNVNGDRQLSGSWTHLLNNTPPQGYTWSRGDWQKFWPENIWPDMWSSMSKKCPQQEKQHWAEEQQKLDRNLLYQSGRQGIQWNPKKMRERTWNCKWTLQRRVNCQHMRLWTHKGKTCDEQWQGDL